MTSVVYPLILLIFIFGASATFINETGLYTHKLPVTGAGYNGSEANQINTALVSSAQSGNSNDFNIQSLVMLGKCILGGVSAIFTLGPLLASYHVPAPMIAWLISPLGIILAFWFVEQWMGRSPE